MPTSTDDIARLVALVRADAWLMNLLRAVRAIELADWCIAAGAVRNLVWDHLHGHSQRTLPSDIDVLFYDSTRIEPGYEAEIEARLAASVPNVKWEAVNQATVHAYTNEPPYRSIEEAMSRWADPVTAVGVCLTGSDDLRIIAPHGLRDLFDLVVRPHLVAPNAAAVYRERIATKQWLQRWPRLTIVPLDSGARPR